MRTATATLVVTDHDSAIEFRVGIPGVERV